MDPSPFHERDLDHDAEEFIVSWAQEHSRQQDLRLLIHLTRPPAEPGKAEKLVRDSVSHYFAYRADMTLHDLRRLMREGRASLIIGLLFLVLCQSVANLLGPVNGHWGGMAREGLTIIGWVAMWKPLDIYLYRWWPLLALRRLYQRLGHMPVEVRCSSMTSESSQPA
ncbi:MAG: hypothetical protein ACO1TE_04440 [Prosthecobacter sp.]